MNWYVGQGSRIVHELLEEKGEDFLMIPLDGHTRYPSAIDRIEK